jgi:hypothetical protein
MARDELMKANPTLQRMGDFLLVVGLGHTSILLDEITVD